MLERSVSTAHASSKALHKHQVRDTHIRSSAAVRGSIAILGRTLCCTTRTFDAVQATVLTCKEADTQLMVSWARVIHILTYLCIYT